MAFWTKLFGNRETPSPANAGRETPKRANASRVLVVPMGGTTIKYTQGDDLKPPFFLAIVGGEREAVKVLLKDGNDPDLVSMRGRMHETPLHWAARHGQMDVVELLLAHNADVNAKDREGETPLQWAVTDGKTEVAELLRQHGGL